MPEMDGPTLRGRGVSKSSTPQDHLVSATPQRLFEKSLVGKRQFAFWTRSR